MSLGLGVNFSKLGVIPGGAAHITFSAIQLNTGSSVGTVVGSASIVGFTTGSPTFSLTNNSSGVYAISGAGVVTIASTTGLAAEVETITIRASGTTPVLTNQPFAILVNSSASAFVPTFYILGF